MSAAEVSPVRRNGATTGPRSWLGAILALAALAVPASARAGLPEDLDALGRGWAHMAYELRGAAAKAAALDRLTAEAAAMAKRYPGRPEPLLWQGVMLSEQAQRASIFRKLGLATRARDLVARAYAIDPRTANGAAAMTLGVLYSKVPGSPIGFGDDARAGRLLREALALDPDGLDVNYFMGDFMFDQGNRAAARTYLQRALRAPHDPARPVWDAGRRRDVRALLARIG